MKLTERVVKAVGRNTRRQRRQPWGGDGGTNLATHGRRREKLPHKGLNYVGVLLKRKIKGTKTRLEIITKESSALTSAQ